MSRQSFVQGLNYKDPVTGVLKPADQAEVFVYEAGTTKTITLYSDRTTGSTIANPFVTGETGIASFWANTGDYDIKVHDTKSRFGDYTFGWQSSPTKTTIAAGDLSEKGDLSWSQDPETGAWIPQIKNSIVATSDFAKQPYARVFRESIQSIPNNLYTPIVFNGGEELDAEELHSTTVTPARIIAKVAGLYFFQLMFTFAGNATGVRNCVVMKNSEAPAKENVFAESSDKAEVAPGEGAGGNAMSASGIVPLAVGDYIASAAYQTSGGALNIMGGDAVHRAAFSLAWIAPKP